VKLYVMRHGHSPSAAEAKVAGDAERPLSDRGRADVRAQAQALRDAGGKPAVILHSPLRRAAETAAEASAVLGVAARPFGPLANQMGPDDLALELAAPLAKAGELLAVGHQPQVGELCAWLAGRLFEFKPAGLVALELDGAPAAKTARLLFDHGASQ
jgi:phosphohistidine phosphatase SixA